LGAEERSLETEASEKEPNRLLRALLDLVDATLGSVFRSLTGLLPRSSISAEQLQRLLEQVERGTDMPDLNESPKVVLAPDNEFEAALIDIVQTFRAKSQGYASADDPFNNFIKAAEALGSTPLRYGENVLAKHAAALQTWWDKEKEVDATPVPSPFSDDGYKDRAVYGIILLCLYKREFE
jgi:hypothetical protein